MIKLLVDQGGINLEESIIQVVIEVIGIDNLRLLYFFGRYELLITSLRSKYIDRIIVVIHFINKVIVEVGDVILYICFDVCFNDWSYLQFWKL